MVEFRAELDDLAKQLVETSKHCTTEEAAKFSLVAPFIRFLGYDPQNPNDVRPEHSADFSDKYRNRVDFALFKNGQPIIAIECKGVDKSRRDDRGQLKAYFNACQPVRVGALTDGIVWEFFVDSDEPNMMDDTPFLVLDLRAVVAGKANGIAYDSLEPLTKANFDPEKIGEEATKRLLFQRFAKQIQQMYSDPSPEFCRLLMRAEGLKNVREAKMPEYQDLVRQAMHAVLDAQILHRLNIPSPIAAIAASGPTTEKEPEKSIVTTPTELAMFMWTKARLGYLGKTEEHFAAAQEISYRDYQTRFVVFLGAERRGRLFEFYEGREKHRFSFPHSGKTIETASFKEIDNDLLEAFELRIKEGVHKAAD
jgi:predicted type IV restriction endonuclease